MPHADGLGDDGEARGRGRLHALGAYRVLGRSDMEREAALEIRLLNNATGSRDRKGTVADLGFKPLSVERVEKAFCPASKHAVGMRITITSPKTTEVCDEDDAQHT